MGLGYWVVVDAIILKTSITVVTAEYVAPVQAAEAMKGCRAGGEALEC